jgi:hypothetical protein
MRRSTKTLLTTLVVLATVLLVLDRSAKASYESMIPPDRTIVTADGFMMIGWKVGTLDKVICRDPVIYPDLKGIVCEIK